MSKQEYDPAAYFQANNYAVVRDFLPKEVRSFLYEYCIIRANAGNILKNSGWEGYSSSDGVFDDPQAPGSFSVYGDPAMDLVMEKTRPMMEHLCGKRLLSTHTFWRMYKHGDVLARHKDRASCEYSTTLCLGYTPGTKQDPNADYQWGIWMDETGGWNNQGTEIKLSPGDMAIYRGFDLEHWREAYQGVNHAQVFLHYIDADGPFAAEGQYDTRPQLGLPPEFRNIEKTGHVKAIADQLEKEKYGNS